METLQTFHGVLDRGFTGNMSFQFHIPHGIHELSVILTYEKERIQDPASYIERLSLIHIYNKGDNSPKQCPS